MKIIHVLSLLVSVILITHALDKAAYKQNQSQALYSQDNALKMYVDPDLNVNDAAVNPKNYPNTQLDVNMHIPGKQDTGEKNISEKGPTKVGDRSPRKDTGS